VVQDRTCNEVREEGDEEEIGKKILHLGLALGEIDKVGDLRKCEERDAKREQDGVRVDGREVKRTEKQQSVVQIFEIKKRQQVERYPKRHFLRAAGGVFRQAANGPGNQVVDQNGAQQEQDKNLVPGSIED
jgi:hypothetical protein